MFALGAQRGCLTPPHIEDTRWLSPLGSLMVYMPFSGHLIRTYINAASSRPNISLEMVCARSVTSMETFDASPL